MNDYSESATVLPRCRMQFGSDVLADWSEHARQTHKNAVHAALFSMLDRTLFATHQVVDDPRRPNEFFVSVKENLVLKLRANGFDSFDLLYIGAWEGAPGFEFTRA
ncbi:MAG: DUF6235 family protein [Actinomycetota bacterium]|nr:DUF6235 family protein [Actinomycetota bacterium]